MGIQTNSLNDPRTLIRGYQRTYTFENGYGLSVICSPVSYGGKDGLFEAALLGLDAEIIYSDKLGFPDVQGFLDFDDIAELIHMVENLPPLEKNS